MAGEDGLIAGFTALFRAPLWELVGEHRYGIYSVTAPEAEGIFLPAGRGDRWLYGAEEWHGHAGVPSADEARRLIRIGAGVPDLPVCLERIGSCVSGAQLVVTAGHAGDADRERAVA